MDKFCEDCIHNEVCQYYAIPPHKDRCNDKDTLDDIVPQGEWTIGYTAKQKKVAVCNLCNRISFQGKTNFCHNCGAAMRKGGAENGR